MLYEGLVHQSVTLYVASDLGQPEQAVIPPAVVRLKVRVAARPPGIAVPVVAVHENGDARPAKDEVGLTGQS
jgi:hypothetical protein